MLIEKNSEFCKNTQKKKRGQREQTMSTMSTQQSTCFCCWDDLSYGLNTLGPLCLWQCFAVYFFKGGTGETGDSSGDSSGERGLDYEG